MQSGELIKYINDPHLLDKKSVGELQKLVFDFPYFQPAHMLLSIASRKWDASVYQQSLKKTAIVVTNREHLFNLIQNIENAESLVEQEIKVPVVEAKIKEEIIITETVLVEAINAKEIAQETENISKEDSSKLKETETAEISTSEKPVSTPEEILEKEIGKQVVASFVEKELLKTNELHHPQPKEEPESFSDWLSLLKKNNGQPLEQSNISTKTFKKEKPRTDFEQKEEDAITDASQLKKQKHRAIIDKIIESSPGSIRNKEDQKFFVADNKAKESLRENEHLVTETLAKIYALQGNVNKAVRAYEILSLKFPQKSAYFATLIQQLKITNK